MTRSGNTKSTTVAGSVVWPLFSTSRRRLVLLIILFCTTCMCFYSLITFDSFPDDAEMETNTGSGIGDCQRQQTLRWNAAAYLSGRVLPPPLLRNFSELDTKFNSEAAQTPLDWLSTCFLCTTCNTPFNNSRLQVAKTQAAVAGAALPSPRTTMSSDSNYSNPANTTKNHPEYVEAYVHPSFVHFVRLIGKPNDTFELDFIQYTAVRTAWQSLSPRLPDLVVLLHSNIEPSGRYWSRLHSIDSVSVSWHYIALKPTIRGTRVRQFAHQADFRRLEVLIQYGGIYMDFDVLLFNATQLLLERWNTECLLQADSPSATTNLLYHYWKGWSYMINMGFMSCTKDSPFLRSWMEQYYEDFRPFYWLYNSGIVPTYLARAYRRRRPGMLGVHRLSGNLMQDYIVSSSAATMTPVKFQEFLRNRFALHMYHIDNDENTVGDGFKDRLRMSNSLLGYLYRYVWFGAEFAEPNASAVFEFP